MKQWDSAILVVDDERRLSQMVKELLQRAGYRQVDTAADCAETRERLGRKEYQLILLDVMLPDGDGFSLFAQLQNTCKTPVIFLSAKDEDSARLRGLGLGADDYITKPFLPEELLLRVGAVLKRVYRFEEREGAVQIGDALVDWGAGTITVDGESQMLTAKEFALLRKLCDNRGRIVSIDELCDTLWPDGSYGYENSLMVHIRRLREKLEKEPSRPKYLVTVRGLGYKLL
ncbi:MAG: response regulator transcription factor [Candidatus Gastranaerophilales bacterium]|nr:response regulator transcription factor [Candidatus Gastranaerophilales bacterium]